MDIKGKRALVTGGSSGIGFEIAKALLELGAQVVIVGRREDMLQQARAKLETFGTLHTIAADITTPDRQQLLVEEAVDLLGGLDILVNNAGGVRAGRLEDIEEDEVRQMIEVNLTAPLLLTRAALPALRVSGDAVIVNVSSSIAQVGLPFYSPYAAAKAGIAHFGEALRREVQDDGIRVLTVYPVGTDTPMMASTSRGKFAREQADDVAVAVIEALLSDDRDVVRGGAARLQLVALNRADPVAVDRNIGETRDSLAEAVRHHRSL